MVVVGVSQKKNPAPATPFTGQSLHRTDGRSPIPMDRSVNTHLLIRHYPYLQHGCWTGFTKLITVTWLCLIGRPCEAACYPLLIDFSGWFFCIAHGIL